MREVELVAVMTLLLVLYIIYIDRCFLFRYAGVIGIAA